MPLVALSIQTPIFSLGRFKLHSFSPRTSAYVWLDFIANQPVEAVMVESWAIRISPGGYVRVTVTRQLPS